MSGFNVISLLVEIPSLCRQANNPYFTISPMKPLSKEDYKKQRADVEDKDEGNLTSSRPS